MCLFFYIQQGGMSTMTTAKIKATLEDEIKLERSYKEAAENMLKATYEKAVRDGTAGETKIGQRLIEKVFDDVEHNIKTMIFEKDYSKGGVLPKHYQTVQLLLDMFGEKEQDELYHLVTMTTMHVLLSSVLAKNKDTLRNNIGTDVAAELQDELQAWWYVHHTNAHNRAFFIDNIEKRSSAINKKYFAQKTYTKEDKKFAMQGYVVPEKEGLRRLAEYAVDAAVKGSGLFDVSEERIKKQTFATIKPKQWLIDTWMKNVDIMAQMSYKYSPMLVAPRPWTSPWDGGYYDVLSRKSHLLRVDWGMSNAYMQAYKQRLNQLDLSWLLSVVNTLQSTPFVINDKVLDVATWLVNNKGGVAGIEPTEPLPQIPHIPAEKWETMTEKEQKVYKNKLGKRHKKEVTRKSRLLRTAVALGCAKRFSVYEKIYFPWNMDYRGRLYPISTEISPQGDDLQKALLSFAEPQEIKDESSEKWFIIEGANRAGVDKVSFNERIQWVKDNEENILKSAEEPLTNIKFWSMQDSPFVFLAWCFEYQKYKKWKDEHGTIKGWRCGVSCNYDGTCSGLQHFSMLLRDEIGGTAVNLVPQETVSDIYGIVAEKVNVQLHEDAIQGTDDGLALNKKTGEIKVDEEGKPIIKYGTRTLAMQWLMFAKDQYGKNGITRKTCKRCVMTFAYGSGLYGFAEQIKEDIIKPYEYAQLDEDKSIFKSRPQAANYLAKLIHDAVTTTVVKAYEGMKWLQDIAQLISKSKDVVQWVTPNGLLVQQNKYKKKITKFQMRFTNVRHWIYMQEDETEIDSKGQVQAIAPNFIHSMDACHMQRVIAAMSKTTNNLFMIHDSFGCDVAYADLLFKTIRYELVALYDNKNWLEYFLNQVSYMIKDQKKIKNIPSFGNLCVKDIEKSKYCFA